MKKISLLMAFSFFAHLSFAQTTTDLSDKEREEKCQKLISKDEQTLCFIDLYSDDKIQSENAQNFREQFKAAIDHAKMVKLESQCEMKDGKKTGMIFYNKECLKKEEVDKIKYENSKYAPLQRSLEEELGDCPNTKDKLRRTEPRFLTSNALIKRIKKDCADENKLSNNSKRNVKSFTESYGPSSEKTPKSNAKNK